MIVLEYTCSGSIKTYDFIPMVLFLIILIVVAVRLIIMSLKVKNLTNI